MSSPSSRKEGQAGCRGNPVGLGVASCVIVEDGEGRSCEEREGVREGAAIVDDGRVVVGGWPVDGDTVAIATVVTSLLERKGVIDTKLDVC